MRLHKLVAIVRPEVVGMIAKLSAIRLVHAPTMTRQEHAEHDLGGSWWYFEMHWLMERVVP